MAPAAPRYAYRVEWSPEDGEYVGLAAEFPSLSWLEESPVDAMAGIVNLVADVVAEMRASGEQIPEPVAERRFSGKIALRTSPDQHRRLAIEAAEQGVSLNQWITQKLAGGAPAVAATTQPTFDIGVGSGPRIVDPPMGVLPTAENASGPMADAVVALWRLIRESFAPGFSDQLGERFLPGGRTADGAQVMPDGTIMVISAPADDGSRPGFIVPNLRARQAIARP